MLRGPATFIQTHSQTPHPKAEHHTPAGDPPGPKLSLPRYSLMDLVWVYLSLKVYFFREFPSGLVSTQRFPC